MARRRRRGGASTSGAFPLERPGGVRAGAARLHALHGEPAHEVPEVPAVGPEACAQLRREVAGDLLDHGGPFGGLAATEELEELAGVDAHAIGHPRDAVHAGFAALADPVGAICALERTHARRTCRPARRWSAFRTSEASVH